METARPIKEVVQEALTAERARIAADMETYLWDSFREPGITQEQYDEIMVRNKAKELERAHEEAITMNSKSPIDRAYALGYDAGYDQASEDCY